MKGHVSETGGEKAAKEMAKQAADREAARRPDSPLDGATSKHFACKACNHEFHKKTIQNHVACPKCGDMCDVIDI